MTTLKEMSLTYKGKRELHDLPSVPVDVEIKEGTFTGKDGKEIPYNYIEIEGYQYTVKAKALTALKRIVAVRPSVTKVKFEQDEKGELFVLPLD